MRRYLSRLTIPLGVSAFVMLACGLTVALQHEKVSAQAAPSTCNVLLVIDRSGSVGQDPQNLPTIKGQIDTMIPILASIKTKENLSINLGFWSFSSAIAPSAATNYDAYNNTAGYMKYTNTASGSAVATFDSAFGPVQAGGGTNYEQGFGYNGYALGSQTMNANANIQELAKHIDVLAFMTDGVPNTPSDLSTNGDDNNPAAISAARAAYMGLVSFNPSLQQYSYGFMVGPVGPATDPSALDYILNGYGTPAAISAATGKGKQYNAGHNPANIKRIDASYTNLESTVEPIMRAKCEQKNNIAPSDTYSLSPVVTSDIVSGGGSATANFHYSVNSTLPSGSTTIASSSWKIEKLVVPKGQSTSSLMFGESGSCGYSAANPNSSVSYCDNIPDCTQLYPLIGGKTGGRSCSDVASNTTPFPHGPTSLDQYATNALTATIDSSSYPVGTKLCFLLILHQPTQDDSPIDRASKAVCLTAGKQPSVQIIGGDLRVGRFFSGDAVAADGSQDKPAQINTSVTATADGKSYGSWVEYAAIAPGAISGFGSLSGLSGGYPSNQPNSQQFWSELTFGNVQNQFGYYTEANNGQGTVPDYASTILASLPQVANPFPDGDSVTLKSGHNAKGVYTLNSGDMTVKASTLGKNETVVLNVPNGTVTIAGNIADDDGPYGSIAEIPQLVIIARTIIIDPGVTNIDAWLIASSATDGTVNTCDDPQTLTVNVCNQQLTINGPVTARHLNLRRTGGSGPADAAETINLSGSLYLWSQSDGQSDVRAQTTLTTELPPYF